MAVALRGQTEVTDVLRAVAGLLHGADRQLPDDAVLRAVLGLVQQSLDACGLDGALR